MLFPPLDKLILVIYDISNHLIVFNWLVYFYVIHKQLMHEDLTTKLLSELVTAIL